MSDEKPTEEEFSKEDQENFEKNGLRQYGVYSAIVFQMLATMGLAFWGGKKINDHFGFETNLLTVGIGFLGMFLAFYNLLQQLKSVQRDDKSDNSKK